MIHAQEQLMKASEEVYKDKKREIEAAVVLREKEREISNKKRKRKTQQLVTEEEVITPRENTFRLKYSLMDKQLKFFENKMNERMQVLNEMQTTLSCMDRDKLNTVDALESSRKLATLYIRQLSGAKSAHLTAILEVPTTASLNRQGSVNFSNVTFSNVISSYEKTIKLLRTKQSSFLLTQALKELGNMCYSNGKGEAAACKAWTDCVDSVTGIILFLIYLPLSLSLSLSFFLFLSHSLWIVLIMLLVSL